MNVVIVATSPDGEAFYMGELPYHDKLTKDLREAGVCMDFIAEEFIQALYAMPRYQSDFEFAGWTFGVAEFILATGPVIPVTNNHLDIPANYHIHEPEVRDE